MNYIVAKQNVACEMYFSLAFLPRVFVLYEQNKYALIHIDIKELLNINAIGYVKKIHFTCYPDVANGLCIFVKSA